MLSTNYDKNHDSLKSRNCKNEKGLIFAHLNTRSMRKKMDDIKLLIKNECIDVFTISESWLDTNVSDAEITIPGYTLFRRDRCLNYDYGNDNGSGGTVCYVKDHINATHRTDLNDDAIEALWVELKPNH